MRKRLVALTVLALLGGQASGANNWFGGQATIANAAATRLSTALSVDATRTVRQLTIRIVPGSANTIYCGPAGVTTVPANARVAINSTTPAYTWAPGTGNITIGDVYCIATTADTVAFVDALE